MLRCLGLLLAFTATACGGPTAPSLEDLIGSYTGRWRGNINGFEAVLDVRAELAQGTGGGFRLSGSGTALNPATRENHPLSIAGSAWLRDSEFILASERGGASTGRFDGELSPDGRTWSGRFRSITAEGAAGGAPIFGPSVYDVTWTKD